MTDNKWKKILLTYGVSILVGLIISYAVMLLEGYDVLLEEQKIKELQMVLCDALFVPAMLFLCVGLLLWLASDGIFDGLTYGMRSFVRMIVPLSDKKPKNYYDYKMERAEKRNDSPKFLLFVGLGFLVLATVFLILWSY